MTKHWWDRFVVGRTAVSDPLQETDRSDPQFELEWRTIVRTRLVIVLGAMILWGVGLEARLVWLQAVEHDAYVKQAESQQFDLVISIGTLHNLRVFDLLSELGKGDDFVALLLHVDVVDLFFLQIDDVAGGDDTLDIELIPGQRTFQIDSH